MENKAGRQEKRKLDSSSRADRIEQALFTTYHKTIWGPFTKAIREYQLHHGEACGSAGRSGYSG